MVTRVSTTKSQEESRRASSAPTATPSPENLSNDNIFLDGFQEITRRHREGKLTPYEKRLLKIDG